MKLLITNGHLIDPLEGQNSGKHLLIEDERVTAIGLYMEGFDDIAAFERLAAQARALKKPIVALKVGRSEAARQATVSHTASLAGDDAVSDAVLARLGIGRAHSIPMAGSSFTTSSTAAMRKRPRKPALTASSRSPRGLAAMPAR